MKEWGKKLQIIGILAIVQIFLLACFFLDPIFPIGLVLIAVVVIVVIDKPLWGVLLLITSRLLSTGATVFVRIGRIGLGPFEPIFLLCFGALSIHASKKKVKIWKKWPWQMPYVVFCIWVFISLFWSVDSGTGISELLPLGIVFGNTWIILTFVRTWKDFKITLWCWVVTCVLIGVLALLSDSLGIEVGVDFQAASGGGRETGLGQQPNWFAMNLMFIIHTCFGMALVEKIRLRRVILICSGLFIFMMMLKSGSRGGAYATGIGAFITALAHTGFRQWFGRLILITVGIFSVGIFFDVGNSASALIRIGSSFALNQNYRQLNWQSCYEMFVDSSGMGIGAGAYKALLPEYNNYVAQSLYNYPHGIFWELLAQYGIIGLLIGLWLIWKVWLMIRESSKLAKGTDAEIFVWSMPAAMLGYVSWSFVEFTITDKPFWEFLSLYTAFYLILLKNNENPQNLEWSGEDQ